MTSFIDFQWLEEDFLSYLDNWRESVRSREGYTDSEKKRMLLSEETESGLRLTGKENTDPLCA